MGQDKINKEVIGMEKCSSEDQARDSPEFNHQVDEEEPAEQTRKGMANEIGKPRQLSVSRKRVYKIPFQMLQVG